MSQTKNKVQERLTKRAEEKKKMKTALATGKQDGFEMDGGAGFALDE